MKQVELVSIDQSGVLSRSSVDLPEMARKNCVDTASYYKVVGFVPPWIGYVTVYEGRVVGGGAFKGSPKEKRVEIAYYTLPEFEGRGFATATARELIKIAKSADPAILVTAQTLPEQNASTAVLKRLGFSLAGTATDPDAGEVWDWHLNA